MPRRKSIYAYFATLGSVGYFAASGTVATFLTLPFVYGLHSITPKQGPYIMVVIGVYIICTLIVHKALPSFDRKDDPSEVILDEVVGCLLTFWAIPLTPQSVTVGFVLFRALDIIKFGWVKKAEQLADAWGIMGDDIVAAIIANLVLRMLYH